MGYENKKVVAQNRYSPRLIHFFFVIFVSYSASICSREKLLRKHPFIFCFVFFFMQKSTCCKPFKIKVEEKKNIIKYLTKLLSCKITKQVVYLNPPLVIFCQQNGRLCKRFANSRKSSNPTLHKLHDFPDDVSA